MKPVISYPGREEGVELPSSSEIIEGSTFTQVEHGVGSTLLDKSGATASVEVREKEIVESGKIIFVNQGVGGGAWVFITDVEALDGVIGMKEYKPSIPINAVLAEATTDATRVRVHFMAHRVDGGYTPEIEVQGVQASNVSQSGTLRVFTGFVDVDIPADGKIVVQCGTARDEVLLHTGAEKPVIVSALLGPYPGIQTAVKQGDVVAVSGVASNNATAVSLVAGGGASSGTFSIGSENSAGNGYKAFSGTFNVSGLSGIQPVTLRASNALGAVSVPYVLTGLLLDQVIPTIGVASISYPVGQTALKNSESATVAVTVQNATSVQYLSHSALMSVVGVTSPFATNCTGFGYEVGSNNLEVRATRSINGSSSSRSFSVAIASVDADASITISGNPARLISSPTGVDYQVRVYPTQEIGVAPTLNASVGQWQGSWQNAGAYWYRSLRIVDNDPKGPAVFSGLSLTNKAGIVGGSIIAGGSYIVGGFTQRNVTFPAFSRVAPLGVVVADQAKTVASITGGNSLVRYSDNAVRQNGYYIANADGSYNPSGEYIGLSDSVFAGSNTSGTLQATVQEDA